MFIEKYLTSEYIDNMKKIPIENFIFGAILVMFFSVVIGTGYYLTNNMSGGIDSLVTKVEEFRSDFNADKESSHKKRLLEKNTESALILYEYSTIINFGLIFVALLSWIGFILNFQPEKAFTSMMGPVMVTFLAFNWIDILFSFGLL